MSKRLSKILEETRELLEMLDATDVLRHAEGIDPRRPRRLIEKIDAYRIKRGDRPAPGEPVTHTFSTAYALPPWVEQ
jgi:hypothetical protein